MVPGLIATLSFLDGLGQGAFQLFQFLDAVVQLAAVLLHLLVLAQLAVQPLHLALQFCATTSSTQCPSCYNSSAPLASSARVTKRSHGERMKTNYDYLALWRAAIRPSQRRARVGPFRRATRWIRRRNRTIPRLGQAASQRRRRWRRKRRWKKRWKAVAAAAAAAAAVGAAPDGGCVTGAAVRCDSPNRRPGKWVHQVNGVHSSVNTLIRR